MLKWALCEQVEKAGGQSSCDGKGVSGLDIEVEKHDQVHFPPISITVQLDHILAVLQAVYNCLHLYGGKSSCLLIVCVT